VRNAEGSQVERRGYGDGGGGSKNGGGWDASAAAGGAWSGSAAGRRILGKAEGSAQEGAGLRLGGRRVGYLAAGTGGESGWWWERPAAGAADGGVDRRLSAGGEGDQRRAAMEPVQVGGRWRWWPTATARWRRGWRGGQRTAAASVYSTDRIN